MLHIYEFEFIAQFSRKCIHWVMCRFTHKTCDQKCIRNFLTSAFVRARLHLMHKNMCMHVQTHTHVDGKRAIFDFVECYVSLLRNSGCITIYACVTNNSTAANQNDRPFLFYFSLPVSYSPFPYSFVRFFYYTSYNAITYEHGKGNNDDEYELTFF